MDLQSKFKKGKKETDMVLNNLLNKKDKGIDNTIPLYVTNVTGKNHNLRVTILKITWYNDTERNEIGTKLTQEFMSVSSIFNTTMCCVQIIKRNWHEIRVMRY